VPVVSDSLSNRIESVWANLVEKESCSLQIAKTAVAIVSLVNTGALGRQDAKCSHCNRHEQKARTKLCRVKIFWQDGIFWLDSVVRLMMDVEQDRQIDR
jgi:hypothetical protein